jgi:hypothetical protein
MAGVAKQIIGSFEDIGKDIASEVAKVPTEIAGKALESLGTSTQKSPTTPTPPKKPEGALGQLDQTKDQKTKRLIAREALAQLAGNQKPKEPTVAERLEHEQEEKKESAKKQQVMQMAPLPAVSTKAKRGNLYAIKQKSSSEMSKNARQD